MVRGAERASKRRMRWPPIHTRLWESSGTFPRRKSKRPIAAWRRSCIRTSIRATRKPKTNSRTSRWPTTSWAIRTARFDRGEIDASGAERPQHRYYRDFAEGGASPYASDTGFADFAGADDILSEIF